MLIKAVVEYNDDGYLIYADNFRGAYTRGKTQEEALRKLGNEIKSYLLWAENKDITEDLSAEIVQKCKTDLQVCDADSEVLFESEKLALSQQEYTKLKELVLKSANDFRILYDSIPDKDFTNLQPRKTFYGDVPRTANEMYLHTNDVSQYYVSQIGGVLENLPDIYENRVNAFRSIEALPDYLNNNIVTGDFNEQWCLRKILRRFLWHDRIHAKAMYRMAISIWGSQVQNPFYFLTDSFLKTKALSTEEL